MKHAYRLAHLHDKELIHRLMENISTVIEKEIQACHRLIYILVNSVYYEGIHSTLIA